MAPGLRRPATAPPSQKPSQNTSQSTSQTTPPSTPPPTPDPLHDPDADSDDAAWVNRNLPHPTDPTCIQSVSCPACFSLLSNHSQPHIRFQGQFRAMYVINCDVGKSRLAVKVNGTVQERYRPVSCHVCDTEVAVLDEKGVYHFCNVIY